MATEVTLPELGESVTEGTITEWLVDVGDEVSEDDPLFELSSDKIDTEVPSPASGILKEIKVDVDETVEVGTVVAIIGSDGGGDQEVSGDTAAEEAEATEDAATDTEADQRAPSEEARPARAGTASTGNGGVAGGDALMSPIVRRMIADHDLDPEQIQGSGQGGRITRDDVEAAIGSGGAAGRADAPTEAKAAKPSKPKKREAAEEGPAFEPGERERVEKLSRIRQRIAAKMQESLTNTAQLTTVQEADMSRIMRLRAQHKDEFKRREGASLSPFVFLVRAAILAIKRHPTVNAKVDWDAGEVLYREYVNLGIAVDTEKGLLVPNIKNADDLTLAALARNIADVAGRARRKGQLEMSDIQGGTFTVTNTGSRGVLIDTPILNYPEVAILGTGAIQKRPKVVDDGLGDTIAIRDLVYLCLTYDHQILDGADAARYVTDVKEVVETHDWEAELGV
ncbi:MAG TPA: 2-oxoglutarate dehydrogenase, E2 component, dihydrolipoamide succinyltransferase [Euzebyales bacterium]|nr:2-oxoglutarate dehydrogenase, E2 component, dihydrolipoamide succinyltransferase [Euzebyales bacterium]